MYSLVVYTTNTQYAVAVELVGYVYLSSRLEAEIEST